MKKSMLLVALFMLGGVGVAFAQEPVKKEKPATEQTECTKEEAKEEPKQEAPAEEVKAEAPAAAEEKTAEAPAEAAE